MQNKSIHLNSRFKVSIRQNPLEHFEFLSFQFKRLMHFKFEKKGQTLHFRRGGRSGAIVRASGLWCVLRRRPRLVPDSAGDRVLRGTQAKQSGLSFSLRDARIGSSLQQAACEVMPSFCLIDLDLFFVFLCESRLRTQAG